MPPVSGVPVPLPGTPLDPPSGPATIAWTVDIRAAPIISPLVTADRVIVAHLPGAVAGFDRATGHQLWRADLAPVQPLATDGTFVFVSAGEALHALRAADGTAAWHAPIGALTAPVVAKDGWIVAATRGKLSGLRASDGSTVWSIEAPSQREAAAISGDVLYVPVVGGRLVARDMADGKEKWNLQLGGDAVEPLVVNDDVFVGASDKRFYCVDARSGDIEWMITVGAAIRGRAATDGDRVIFTALDNVVHAVDRGNGARLWHKGVPFRPLFGPVVAAGAVFVAGPAAMRAFRSSNGDNAGTITFPARQAVAPGWFDTGAGVVFAAVTGNLEESWKLTLTVPLPATLRPSR